MILRREVEKDGNSNMRNLKCSESMFKGILKPLSRFYFLLAILIMFTSQSCSENKIEIIDIDDPNDEIPVDDDYNPVPFAGVPDTEDIVMYELNPKLFGSTNVFQNIIPHLDDIKRLGVNVLWIMPIHPKGQVNSINSPYAVQNYLEVNPDYGTLNDLRELVQETHNRDMAFIIDWVPNHTAWDNPWIENKSWYTQDGSGNIVHPPGTNWEDVADLDYSNSDMRKAMIDAMKYWVLNANIDGFRVDASDFVPYSFWQEAVPALDAIPGRKLIHLSEGARRNHYDAGFHMNYAWDFYYALRRVYHENQSAVQLYNTANTETSPLSDGQFLLRYTTNHDYSAWDATPVTLYGGQQAALSGFVAMVSSGGIPLIYSSQEVGVSGTVPFFNPFTVRWDQNPDVRQMYEKIMGIYNSNVALRRGTLEWHGNLNVWFVVREYAGQKLAVLANTRNSASTVSLPTVLANKEVTDLLSETEFDLGSELQLSAHQYLIFKID